MIRPFVLIIVLAGCLQLISGCAVHGPNPPANGFNAGASDDKAVRLADATMRAMGGRDAWDNTRYITWNFFDRATHLWDKHANRDRIEFRGESGTEYIVIINLTARRGIAWIDGQRVTNHDKLERLMDQAWNMWVNDSYWLVMPYKLKDTGVTLNYVDDDETDDGVPSDVVQLTFDDVGVTPENKYHVWIAKDSRLVRQFAYYQNQSDDQPVFVAPWRDWTQHGKIMLSGNRGTPKITDIAVLEQVPATAWTRPDPVKLH